MKIRKGKVYLKIIRCEDLSKIIQNCKSSVYSKTNSMLPFSWKKQFKMNLQSERIISLEEGKNSYLKLKKRYLLMEIEEFAYNPRLIRL